MTIQEYNDLYKNNAVKKMKIITSSGITITNSNIAQESVELEQSLCSETNLHFGACEAACFKVRILDMNHSFLGEWLDVYQEIYTDVEGFLLKEDGDYLLTEDGFKIQLENEAEGTAYYGRFKVYSDKPTNDRIYRDLTCYDIMFDILNADVTSWYNGLTFPMTVKTLRDSFFTELGVTQETATLVNDNFETPGGFTVDGQISGKDIITAICELNGVFGQISNDGMFTYISLPSNETIALDWYYKGTGAYEDYEVEEITGILARSTLEDAGTSVGTPNNQYIIEANPLIYGTESTEELTTALTSLLGQINGIAYRPFSVKTYGNPMLPLGTNVQISTSSVTIYSFVMTRYLRGIQALTDEYKAVGDKYMPANLNSLQSSITRSKGKIHELINTTDELTSTIEDLDENLTSQISQLADEIVLKVDDDGNIVQVELSTDPDEGTNFKVTADNISFIANDTIELTTNELAINSTNFSVDKNGHLESTSAEIGCMTVDGQAVNIYKIDYESMPTDSNNKHYFETQKRCTISGDTDKYFQVLVRAYYIDYIRYSSVIEDAVYLKYKYKEVASIDEEWNLSWDDTEGVTSAEFNYYIGDINSTDPGSYDGEYVLYFTPELYNLKPFMDVPHYPGITDFLYFQSGSYIPGTQTEESTAVWNTYMNGSGGSVTITSKFFATEEEQALAQFIETDVLPYLNREMVKFYGTDPYFTMTPGGVTLKNSALIFGEKIQFDSDNNDGIFIGSNGLSVGPSNSVEIRPNGYAIFGNLTIKNKMSFKFGNNLMSEYNIISNTYNSQEDSGYTSINSAVYNPQSIYSPDIEEAIRFVYHDTSSGGYGAYRGVLRGYWYAEALYGNVPSSIHAKENIKPINEEEAKRILEIKTVSFDYKNGIKNKRGIIAEELDKIYPNCVNYPLGTTRETYEYDESKPDSVPGIDYIGLIPYLIKMVQIQQDQIADLQKQIDELKK